MASLNLSQATQVFLYKNLRKNQRQDSVSTHAWRLNLTIFETPKLSLKDAVVIGPERNIFHNSVPFETDNVASIPEE